MIRPSSIHGQIPFPPLLFCDSRLYGHKSCCVSSYSYVVSPDQLPYIGLPWSSSTYSLIFSYSMSQGQAERRSTWALGFSVSRWVCSPTQSRCRLSFLKYQPSTTTSWHHGRRFKGGVARVTHERGPTYAKTSTATGFKYYTATSGFRMAVSGCTKSNFGSRDK